MPEPNFMPLRDWWPQREAGGLCQALAPACLPTYLALLGHLAAGFADLVVLLRDWRARSALESNVLPQDGQALGSFKKS